MESERAACIEIIAEPDLRCFRKSVSVAKWNPERGLAEVTSVKGKWNLVMGCTSSRQAAVLSSQLCGMDAFGCCPRKLSSLSISRHWSCITAEFLFPFNSASTCWRSVIFPGTDISRASSDHLCCALICLHSFAHLKRSGYVVLRTSIYRLKRERDARDRAREAAEKAAQPAIVAVLPPAAAATASPCFT